MLQTSDTHLNRRRVYSHGEKSVPGPRNKTITESFNLDPSKGASRTQQDSDNVHHHVTYPQSRALFEVDKTFLY